MAKLKDMVSAMDSELRPAEIPDYPNALNGLQLASRSGEVGKVVAAVDASLPVVRGAIELGADLLVVHHGMFWQGAQKIEGAMFDKISSALEAGLAIYSSHIPLDVHPTLGNNAVLTKALGLGSPVPFFDWKGIALGLKGEFSGSRDDLRAALEEATGAPAHLCPGGNEAAGTVGVITGGAGSEVYPIAAEGIDTFVSGEGRHWSYTSAEELGLNVLYGGHYATETFGVKALAGWLAETFGVEADFFDHPTGL